MPLYNAFMWEPATRSKRPLGRVRGRNQPNAWLNACRKYRVPAAEQRRLGVEAVVPPPPPPPVGAEDRALMREFSAGMNAALRTSLGKRK